MKEIINIFIFSLSQVTDNVAAVKSLIDRGAAVGYNGNYIYL